MTQIFTAVINGKIFTRASNHKYTTAGAWVNINTGEVRNVTFSKEYASPPRDGVCGLITNKHRRCYASTKAFKNAQQTAIEKAKNWRLEVVNVQPSS